MRRARTLVFVTAAVVVVGGAVGYAVSRRRRRGADETDMFEAGIAAMPLAPGEVAEVRLDRLMRELGWRTDDSHVCFREDGRLAEIVNLGDEKVTLRLGDDGRLRLRTYERSGRMLVRRDSPSELRKLNLSRAELDAWLAANPA